MTNIKCDININSPQGETQCPHKSSNGYCNNKNIKLIVINGQIMCNQLAKILYGEELILNIVELNDDEWREVNNEDEIKEN